VTRRESSDDRLFWKKHFSVIEPDVEGFRPPIHQLELQAGIGHVDTGFKHKGGLMMWLWMAQAGVIKNPEKDIPIQRSKPKAGSSEFKRLLDAAHDALSSRNKGVREELGELVIDSCDLDR
jgi:hypothetical protein